MCEKLALGEIPEEPIGLLNALVGWLPVELESGAPAFGPGFGGCMVDERLPSPLNVENAPSGVPPKGFEPNPVWDVVFCPDEPYDVKGSVCYENKPIETEGKHLIIFNFLKLTA